MLHLRQVELCARANAVSMAQIVSGYRRPTAAAQGGHRFGHQVQHTNEAVGGVRNVSRVAIGGQGERSGRPKARVHECAVLVAVTVARSGFSGQRAHVAVG